MPGNPTPLKKRILGLEMLMNLVSCDVCHQKFSLGETVVLACGSWNGPAKWIHEEDAVLDSRNNMYYERGCYESCRDTGRDLP